MATEININDLLEASEAEQKALQEQREKERKEQTTAARTKELSAARKKKIEDTQNQITFLESNIQKRIETITKLRSQSRTAGGTRVNEEIKELEALVNKYNTTVREFNRTAPVERTPAMGGIPGAGRATQPKPPKDTGKPLDTTVSGSDTGPKITIRNGQEKAGTGTGGATGVTGSTGGAGGGKTKTTPKTPKDIRQAGEDALVKAGINQAVVQYMKENYPQDWVKIKDLRDKALATDGVISADEQRRIDSAFLASDYYKNVAVEKNRTTIGAYMILNGLDTASNAALIDRLTDDVFVKKISTTEQAQAQIRKIAVDRLGLNSPDADPSKKKIAQAMLDAGQAFTIAAKDYIAEYATLMDIPLNQFDPFEDAGFLSSFNAATSLDDFRVKAKGSTSYLESRVGRQEVNATKLQLQQLSRGLGLGYNPQRLEEQALNVVSGKETLAQLEFSLRSIAGEAFPAFKDRILAGETIASIASPYVSSMSRILEMPDSSIDISDPNNEIRKALIGDGKAPKPLWQFEQELFKDARWQYTSNARDTMDRVSMDILKRFGVMG